MDERSLSVEVFALIVLHGIFPLPRKMGRLPSQGQVLAMMIVEQATHPRRRSHQYPGSKVRPVGNQSGRRPQRFDLSK